MGKGKSREYRYQEIGELMIYSFQFNLVGYVTRDVCVGMAGLRMRDIERTSMSASQIMQLFNVVEIQG